MTGQEVLDALAQAGPIRWRDVEVSPEVEQGALLHFGPRALGAHKAEGDIVLVAAAGTGTPDEHEGECSAAPCLRQDKY